MALADVIIIISRNGGAFVSRWLHVVVGITWIGLLYYFNFVQVPSFAEMEAAARNNAIDKLASRALWWFRWAAAATLRHRRPDPPHPEERRQVAAVLRRLHQVRAGHGDLHRHPPRAHDVPERVARDLAQPEEGHRQRPQRAGRRRGRSRRGRRRAQGADGVTQNTIFSFTMLLFMVGTSHFFLPGKFKFAPSGGDRATYWIIVVVIWGLLELNGPGRSVARSRAASTRSTTPTRWRSPPAWSWWSSTTSCSTWCSRPRDAAEPCPEGGTAPRNRPLT